jgi:pimeloyl-ACP methyl ester carboxylesterase
MSAALSAREGRGPRLVQPVDCSPTSPMVHRVDIAGHGSPLVWERLTVVGYSMGGMVAQLLWRRHPERVAGLVLCATARNVRGSVF